jgi:small subunit ribosomal protein S20
LANIKSSIKRAKQSIVRRSANITLRTRMRTAIKKTYVAIESAVLEDANASFKDTQSEIDKMVTKGIITKNRAAGYKSRINTKIKNLIA